MRAIHLLIRGKVQGVFYRASARDKALELGLTGWVRNTPEGHVEALACGQPAALEQFADWCRQGPPDARVTEVTVTTVPEETSDGFRILR